MNNTVAILAGGLATRLRPITETIPKAMVEVAGKPFVEHQIELLRRNGLTKIVICAGYLGEQIESFLGDGSKFGVTVKYSYDGDKLLGTGGALKKAEQLLDDSFYVLYGDSYLDINYQDIGKHFAEGNHLGLMTVYPNSDQWDKSNVLYEDGIVKRYDKRNPSGDMKYIDYGLGLLKKQVLEEIPANEVHDLSDLYSDLSKRGQLLGFEVDTRFYEIGSHSGLEEMINTILENKNGRI
jgi:MurNAc alpha-1-phosphate uridylyltransferase